MKTEGLPVRKYKDAERFGGPVDQMVTLDLLSLYNSCCGVELSKEGIFVSI